MKATSPEEEVQKETASCHFNLIASSKETHSVTGEALHKAEDGAIKDVRDDATIADLFLLLVGGQHLG